MSKTILITGAGSGFGKAAAIGMAKNGHSIIATVQVSSQVTPLREEAASLGLIEMTADAGGPGLCATNPAARKPTTQANAPGRAMKRMTDRRVIDEFGWFQ